MLIVVSNRSIPAMLRNSLVQFDHNVVASADNSIGAVKLFKKTEPNVVVLDKNLADVLTGVELADLMENIDPNIQLIFLMSVKTIPSLLNLGIKILKITFICQSKK